MPRDLRNNQSNFVTGVVYDNPPVGKRFGQVVTDANTQYRIGDTVQAVFCDQPPAQQPGAPESTFLEVQRKVKRRLAGGGPRQRLEHPVPLVLAKDGFWGTSGPRCAGPFPPAPRPASTAWSTMATAKRR